MATRTESGRPDPPDGRSRTGAAAAAIVIGVTVLAAFGRPGPRAPFTSPGSANVVLILVDSLRADRLGCYGAARPTSPHVDSLSRRSLLFENALTTAPWTVPAVASLFTSTYPSRHGQTHSRGLHGALSEDMVTLPELLRERGWGTVAFSSHPWVSPALGFGQGFAAEDFHVLRGRRGGPKNDPAVTAAVVEWLQRRGELYRPSGKQRFFAYLHYMGPHSPYAPSAEAQRAVLGGVPSPTPFAASLAGQGMEGSFALMDEAAESQALTREDVDYLLGQYDAEVFTADAHIGRVLHALRQAGLEENTLVAVTADHGEAFMEHGRMVHVGALYRELLHVPLLIHLPGQQVARRIAHRVQTIDVLPTILDALGLLPLPAAQGRSRWPDRDSGGGPAFAEAAAASADNRWAKLVRDDFSYIADLTKPRQDELYDLRRDPAETRNVRREYPAVARAMRREILRFRAANEREARPLRRRPPPQASAEVEERLRALGYVQ